MIENIENEQMNRLCAPGTHEGRRFNKRLNFFLMVESVLLVVIGVLLSRPTTGKMILLTFMFLGLVLTIVWGYVQAKQQSVSRRIEGAPDEQGTVLKPEQIKRPGSSTSLFTSLRGGRVGGDADCCGNSLTRGSAVADSPPLS